MAHLPGYNYCGPGTSDFSRKPRNQLDKLCRDHDLAYGEYGAQAYIRPNPADDLLINQGPNYGTTGRIISEVFRRKRVYAEAIGISPIRGITKKQKMPNARGNNRYRSRRRPTRRRGSKSIKRRSGYRPRKRMLRRKRKYTRKRTVKSSLARQVMDGMMTGYQSLVTHRIEVAQGKKNMRFFTACNASNLNDRSAAAKAIQSDSGVLSVATVDFGAAGLTFPRVAFLDVSVRLTMRNNTTAPAFLKISEWVCKKKTVQDVDTLINDGIDDKFGTSLTDITDCDVLYSPNDSKNFLRHFKKVRQRKGELLSGQEVTYSYSTRPFTFNIDLYDESAFDYDVGHKVVIVEVMGCLVHDTTTNTNISRSETAIDVEEVKRYKYGLMKPSRRSVLTGVPSINYETVTNAEFADPQEGKMEVFEE